MELILALPKTIRQVCVTKIIDIRPGEGGGGRRGCDTPPPPPRTDGLSR